MIMKTELEKKYTEDDFPIEIDVPFHCEQDEYDEAHFQIDNMKDLKAINRLAAEFYSNCGYMFIPDMDFYGSSHPQESGVFMQACQAFYLISRLIKESE
jgi:hypothetical protein